MNFYIWKSDVLNSMEYAGINKKESSWNIISTVILSLNEKESFKIDYAINLNGNWELKEAVINSNNLGIKKTINVKIDENKNWIIDGKKRLFLNTCTDIDLGFTPLTNTIPIRRLDLQINESAEIIATWIQFPSFEIKPLEQLYTRIDENSYLYESGTNFKAKLLVDEKKIVIDYPKYWKLIAKS